MLRSIRLGHLLAYLAQFLVHHRPIFKGLVPQKPRRSVVKHFYHRQGEWHPLTAEAQGRNVHNLTLAQIWGGSNAS